MTREETKKCIEVMQAYVDGEEIECRWKGANEGDWRSEEEPHWYWNTHDYRIKPQPMKVTEEEMEYMKAHAWIKFKSDGRIVYDIFKFAAPEMKKRFVNNFYVLNSDTMEWEDWSQDAERKEE